MPIVLQFYFFPLIAFILLANGYPVITEVFLSTTNQALDAKNLFR